MSETPEPRYARRLSDKVLIGFHHACDQGDIEVAGHLLDVLEFMIHRTPHLPDARSVGPRTAWSRLTRGCGCCGIQRCRGTEQGGCGSRPSGIRGCPAPCVILRRAVSIGAALLSFRSVIKPPSLRKAKNPIQITPAAVSPAGNLLSVGKRVSHGRAR
jgi:hypothetical protein